MSFRVRRKDSRKTCANIQENNKRQQIYRKRISQGVQKNSEQKNQEKDNRK